MTKSAVYGALWIGVVLALVMHPPARAQQPASELPWWHQQKLSYFWHPWWYWDGLGGKDTSKADVDPVSNEDLIKQIAAAGATVFVDRQDWTFYTDIKDVTPAYSEDYYGQTRPAILNRARLAAR